MTVQEDLRLQGADNFRSLKGIPSRCGRRIGGRRSLAGRPVAWPDR